MKYTVGIQNFEDLHKAGYCYVDKTALIIPLNRGWKILLPEPTQTLRKKPAPFHTRRLFEGKKELEQLEQNWTAYLVLHLDMNAQKIRFP